MKGEEETLLKAVIPAILFHWLILTDAVVEEQKGYSHAYVPGNGKSNGKS
jgi:hypothetical protein